MEKSTGSVTELISDMRRIAYRASGRMLAPAFLALTTACGGATDGVSRAPVSGSGGTDSGASAEASRSHGGVGGRGAAAGGASNWDAAPASTGGSVGNEGGDAAFADGATCKATAAICSSDG